MTSIAIGALVLGGLASFGVVSASAAGPTITATPSTGLQNGSVVTVAGTGFMDNETVYALECLATAKSQIDCDLSTASATMTSATGTFSTAVTVATGTIAGTTTCGTSSTDLSNCAIVVSTNPPTADQAIAPITFAMPTTTTTTTIPVKVGPRRFHVSPVSGLVNRSLVRVWGTGFKPHDQVYVVECLKTSKSQAGCDLKTLKPVRITASGVLPSFKFRVVAGKIGKGFCGTKLSNLKSCAISVGNATKGDSAQVRIAFK
ncbi:MAG TPA: neocarzinostatin apoprotein domain-containing protein [Acidimicrobiales bacterium]|nr:neocarzinostatin apoprotein domain-containing protein [Acidimicrobiales bacterium]